MQFRIDPVIFERFPSVQIGIISAASLNNSSPNEAAADLLKQQVEISHKELENAEITTIPEIAAWRDAYREFGSKPRDYQSSIEALSRRVSKGNELPSINPLVDIYNAVSIKYGLPVGGEDIDAMQGDLLLTIAAENESAVTVLGKEASEAPYAGEVIYKDDSGTICRRWNWREVARTVLTNETTNAVLVIECLTNPEQLRSAVEELGQLVELHCAASVSNAILDSTNHSTALN